MFIFDTLMNRMRRGCQTMAYPKGPAPALPDRHGGALRLDAVLCPDGCTQCEGVCPVGAITLEPGQGTRLDLGRCLFCGDCVRICPHGAITTTNDHRLAVRRREDLILGKSGEEELRLAAALDKKMKSLLGRSLRLRQVSAGGCNACEADINVLGTIGWDLGRFGIQYVASPRHADGVLVTGPVTKGMELALQKTWEALPEPRIAIALGSCAISGGPFIGHAQHNGGADPIIPIDLYIPGCPPHPLTILDGFLRLLDRLPKHNL
jgi:Ni,Fe-hydrogenase III small subunit/NAD-dependent dihydropyrimidine dehydrogenase PreA subunit